jgi:iron-sulfur cluster repair protein YtfE (RIC family)
MPDAIKKIMSQDHKHCDDLFTHLDSLVMEEKWKQAESQATIFIDHTLNHFKHEEEVLFPAFEAATDNISGPTMVMKQEHNQMRELFIELKQAVKDRNFDRYSGISETLNIFIQQHNMKEEGVLYPMIDNACHLDSEKLIQNMLNRPNKQVA